MLEVLLSLAIIALIAGISVPIYQALQIRNNLNIAAISTTQTWRRAQILAAAADGDSPWGVYATTGGLTLFKGANYVARDNTFDEIIEIPTSIVPTGMSEIIFNKFTGQPQSVGSLILTSDNNETKTITINVKGAINY